MINISVFSNENVSIENTEYHITNQAGMIKFLSELLNKVYYGGERICLEKADIVENKVNYTEINRWQGYLT
jgi:hypothetical protein